jgi:ubiquinol-cytochrome c reductase iron-sulfur subunit
MARAIQIGAPAKSAEPTKRDFINILAVTATVGAAGAFAWPMIDQLNPAADTLAMGSSHTVDLTKVQPGQQIVVLWRKMPILVVNRTPAILAELTKPTTLGLLRDPHSSSRQQPSYVQSWCRSIEPEFLVVIGICTHLGCIPGFEPTPGSLTPNWPGGWLCPCHGSRYDLAGRVFIGAPAPLNLPVPPYHIENKTSLVIGADPPGGASFEVSQLEAL